MLTVNQALKLLTYSDDLSRLLVLLQEATEPDVLGSKAAANEADVGRLLRELVRSGLATQRAVDELRLIARLVHQLVMDHEPLAGADLAATFSRMIAHPN